MKKRKMKKGLKVALSAVLVAGCVNFSFAKAEEEPTANEPETTEVAPESTPEATPEVVAEPTLEATPEVTPESTPEATPESTPVATIAPVIVENTPEPTTEVDEPSVANVEDDEEEPTDYSESISYDLSYDEELTTALLTVTVDTEDDVRLDFANNDTLVENMDAQNYGINYEYTTDDEKTYAFDVVVNGEYTFEAEVLDNEENVVGTKTITVTVEGLNGEGAPTVDEPTTLEEGEPDESDGEEESEAVATIASTGESFTTIEDAINAASDGDTITIIKDGKYTAYNKVSTNKSLTIQAADDCYGVSWYVGYDPSKEPGQGENCDYSFDSANTITFKNMYIYYGFDMETGDRGENTNLGFARIQNYNLENCYVYGEIYYSGYVTSTFKNTEFNAPGYDKYSFDRITASDTVNFENCTFKGWNKFVDVYSDATGLATTLNFNNCTVNSETDKDYKPEKAFVNIKDNVGNYTVNFNGTTTINGDVNRDTNTCTRLFQVKTIGSEGTYHATVNINGNTVWANGTHADHSLLEDYEDVEYITIEGEWTTGDDGIEYRTVTKTCNYCGNTIETIEYEDCNANDSCVAHVDSTGKDYDSLAKAIEVASDSDTVTLLKSVTESVTIEKNLTLDLADLTVTSARGAAITVNNATVTINNGTVTGGTDSGLRFNDATATLNDMVITDNTAFSNCNMAFADETHNGGGITAKDSTLTISKSTLKNNTVTADYTWNCANGGAICATGGSLTINSETSFENNSAEDGGAIATSHGTVLNLDKCTFVSNTATAQAGAIWVANDAGKATITDCVFTENTANIGGAIDGFYNSATIEVTGSTFENNSAKSYGGAISTYTTATKLVVDNCDFNSNAAVSSGNGGAIYMMHTYSDLFSGIESEIKNSRFVENTATMFGGAIVIVGDSTDKKKVNIESCSFDKNSASYAGGAIQAGTAEITLIENTFTQNSTEKTGGAIQASTSEITFVENTFTENSANYGGALQLSASNAEISSNNAFTKNIAQYLGGAIYAHDNSNITIDASTSITENTSLAKAGGIYVRQNATVTIASGAVVNNNTATSEYGGSDILSNGNLTIGTVGEGTLATTGKTIDGWYYDGDNAETSNLYEFGVFTKRYEGTTYSGKIALIAASATEATVTADKLSKLQGHDEPELTATSTINGLAYTVTRTPGEDIGTYEVTVTGDEYQTVNGNTYKVTYVGNTFEITKASCEETNSCVAYIESTNKYYDNVVDAINDAAETDTVHIVKEGTYTTYNQTSVAKNLTLTADVKDVTWTVGYQDGKSGENGDYSFQGADSLTIKNMTVEYGTGLYLGFAHVENFTLENCTVEGKITYAGNKTSTFKNTVFNSPGSDYMFEQISATDTVDFDGCTFNGQGKFLNVYKDGSAGNPTINFTNCEVNSTKENKSFVNIKDTTGDYVINFKNVTLSDNLNRNKTTCTRLFQVEKPQGTAGAKVTVDGTTVWENGDLTDHAILEKYEDVEYTTTYGEWTTGDDGKEYRTVTKVCKHCGRTVETTESREVVKPTPSSNSSSSSSTTTTTNAGCPVGTTWNEDRQMCVSDTPTAVANNRRVVVTPTVTTPTTAPTATPEATVEPSATPEATATPSATPSATAETITEEETPEAATGHWALINLIAGLATTLLGVILLLSKKEKESDEEDSNEGKQTRKSVWKVVGAVDAVAAVVTFLLTENLTKSMVLTDKWTILMAVFAVVNVASLILGRKYHTEDTEENA